jgi:hypothetical protein
VGVRHVALSLKYGNYDHAGLENDDQGESVAVHVDATFEAPTAVRLKSRSSTCSERFTNIGSLNIAIVTMLSGVKRNEKLIGRPGTASLFQSFRIGHLPEDSST